nr:Flp family type IVb pilin [Nocardioides scoriae]
MLPTARRDEHGASAVEYGLLGAAIAAIIVVLVFAIGKLVQGGFSTTCTSLATGTSSTQTC